MKNNDLDKTVVLDAYHYLVALDNLKAIKAKEFREMHNIKSIEDCKCVADEVMAGFVDDSLDDQLTFEFINSKVY